MEDILLRLGLTASLIETFHLGLLGRLLLASLLGGIIGLERELSGKPAGLRTNLLICVGSALLTEVSVGVAGFANVANSEAGAVFRADPGRIAAQIVSGIGFLGAGTIIQSRGNVIGLTTAATIWVVAAIGMAVGARSYVEAIGSAVLVFLALVLLGRLEELLIRRRRTQRYHLGLAPDPDVLLDIGEMFRKAGLRVETESVEKGLEQFDLALDVTGPVRFHARVQQSLAEHPGVRRMTRVL